MQSNPNHKFHEFTYDKKRCKIVFHRNEYNFNVWPSFKCVFTVMQTTSENTHIVHVKHIHQLAELNYLKKDYRLRKAIVGGEIQKHSGWFYQLREPDRTKSTKHK